MPNGPMTYSGDNVCSADQRTLLQRVSDLESQFAAYVKENEAEKATLRERVAHLENVLGTAAILPPTPQALSNARY